MSARFAIETLESRTLLSGTALSAAVQADHLQIQADLLQFRLDALNNFVTMQADVTAIKADHPRNAGAVFPLLVKMRNDVKQMRQTLLADRMAEAKAVVTDELIIVKDLAQKLADVGNPAAEAADTSKLLADRIKLQTDMIAGLDARIAHRQAGLVTIAADAQAVVTAAESDPNASAKLVADLQKWSTDKTNCVNTLTADLQKLAADRTQLVTDLTAMENS